MRVAACCVAGLLYDWMMFVAWTVIPIRAEAMGADAGDLGLLQTASTVVYTFNCLLFGRLADRMSHSWLVRAGCVGAIAACFAIGRVETMGLLFLVVPLMGFASSVFWPSLQAALGRAGDPARLERTLGLFNIMWSLGKGLGFLLGGWMSEAWSEERTLWVAAAAILPILFFFPGTQGTRGAPAPPASPDRAAFRTIGYIANFTAYGLACAFQNQYYKFALKSGLGAGMGAKAFFGAFLGAIFASQTLTFTFLLRGGGWAYRRGLLYGSQLILVASAVAASFARDENLILVLALPLGAGFGFSYASSIYYSLHGPVEHGKYSGIHEAVLGAGAFIVPLAGGHLADALGDLRIPYWLGAAAVAAAIAVEEALYRTRSRS